MDQTKFLTVLKQIVREEIRNVIKQELTDIIKEGLKPTISEIKQKTVVTKNKVAFNENRYSNILNETSAIQDQHNPLESYSQLMSEGIEELKFTSRDAQSFPMMRQSTKNSIEVPKIMYDPETGKDFEVKPEVASALTRDYSALMKAMDSKKRK